MVPPVALAMRIPVGRFTRAAARTCERAAGRSFVLMVALAAIASSGSWACAWLGAAGPKANPRVHAEPRETHVVHEDCPVAGAGATAEDINGDGRPDRRTVFGTAGVRCRAFDFDFDGHVDAWVYLDPKGDVRRRENDFDRDGVADEVSLYDHGVLVEQQRSTSQAGKLDTWHFFEAGRLARTERDANGDDYVDQWWEYPNQRASDCPLIHSDVDGDGRPDPGATVDVCREGAVGTEKAETEVPPTGVSEVPTEVETTEPDGAAPATPDAPAEPRPAPGGKP